MSLYLTQIECRHLYLILLYCYRVVYLYCTSDMKCFALVFFIAFIIIFEFEFYRLTPQINTNSYTYYQTNMHIDHDHHFQHKFKTSTSQSSQNTYEQCLMLQQERIVDQNQLNDDHCFKCNKKGELYCCDRCFRAFHKTCISTRRFSKVWSCQYCNNHNLCITCSQPQPYNLEAAISQKYICTICFRFVHKECQPIPEHIMKSQSHYFSSCENYVCLPCLKQFGFKMVLSWSRVLINEEEKLLYFVNINTRSPIHCGWFEEEMLRDVPRYKQAEQLIEADVCEFPIIERIVRMKIPLQYKQQEIDQLLNQFLLGENGGKSKGEYGSGQNFYFLVVWEGSDYTKATWQDQKIIWINNSKNKHSSQFIKYILYRKLETALKDKSDLQPIYDLFHKLLPSTPERLRDKQIAEMHQHFKANVRSSKIMCLYLGEQYSETIDFLYYYLQERYFNHLVDAPTLILCNTANISRWERKAREACLHLNTVSFKGSEANIQEIKMKQVNFQLISQNKFHVLIVGVQRWTKQKRYLSYKGIKFESIIFDETIPESIIDEIEFQKLLKYDHKICIYSKNGSKKEKKILEITLKLSQGFVYDLQNYQIFNHQLKPINRAINIHEQMEKIRKKDIIVKDKEEFKLLERIALLKYFIAFGFNYASLEAFEKICKFAPGIFKKQDLFRVGNYIQKFMSALFASKNNNLSIQHSEYYFIDLKPLSIYKQICNLAKMKKLVEDHRNSIQTFPYDSKFKVFFDKYIVQLNYWNGIHDYLLAALVIEKGFGKWTEIAYSKQWFKYTSPQHFEHIPHVTKPQLITYADYVRQILYLNRESLNSALIMTEAIIQERVSYLLYMMK